MEIIGRKFVSLYITMRALYSTIYEDDNAKWGKDQPVLKSPRDFKYL